MVIRHSPAEFYIKALIVHPDGLDNDAIENLIRSKQLDFIGRPYLDELRRLLVTPNPFFPEDEYHASSQRFLAREGIQTIFLPDADMRLALVLLEVPKAKELIESSSIAGFNDAWIASLLRNRGFEANPDAVNLYRQFFWNLRLVDSLELKALIQLRVAAQHVDDPYELASAGAAWKAHYSDARWLAAKMPMTPAAGIMHQLRMGIIPSNLEVSRIASAARTAATVLTLDSLTNGDSPERSQGYALTAKLMSEVLDSVGTPESELFGSLHQIMIEQEFEPVPNIKQLTDGQHTIDLQPMDGKEVDHEDR